MIINEGDGMRIGFIGVGNMGGPIATHLISAGHDLSIFDLNEAALSPLVELGARQVSSAAATAENSEAVFLSLPMPRDVEEVVSGAGGLFSVMDAGQTVIDLSTSSPTLSRSLALEGQERGIDFLDAPVSGGVYGARKGTLAVMVGGSEEAFERSMPLFELFAAKAVRCGDAGAGNVVKAVNNMLAFVGMMGATEALLLGSKAGVDPKVLREVVEASSGASFVWSSGTRAILRDRLAPSFTSALACKDIGLAVDLADELEVPVPMGRHTQQLLETYRDNGFADEDILATVRALEDEANFVVRGLAPDIQ